MQYQGRCTIKTAVKALSGHVINVDNKGNYLIRGDDATIFVPYNSI